MHKLGCCYALLVGCFKTAVAYIVHHSASEQVCFLQHHAQTSPKVGLADGSDGNIIIQNCAVLYIVEAINEVSYGGLTSSSSTHKRNFLPCISIEVDIK